MKRLRRGALRDQSDSAFSAILTRLCDDTGALAAALVDAEGETVDYAGLLTPYEVKVAAAEWRIVLGVVHAAKVPGFRQVAELVVRAGLRTFAISAMPDGYAIALCLPRRSFAVSPRAMAQAKRELAGEAGLVLPAGRAQATWASVRVRIPQGPQARRRPNAIWMNNGWSPITILGRYQDRDLSRSERGYLAQLASGAEVFLVRERLGTWFVDNASVLTA